jgi:hypothetical protein
MKRDHWITLIIILVFLFAAWSDSRHKQEITYPSSGYSNYPNYGSGYGSYPSTSSSTYNSIEAYNRRQQIMLENEERQREYMDKYYEIEERKNSDIGKY